GPIATGAAVHRDPRHFFGTSRRRGKRPVRSDKDTIRPSCNDGVGWERSLDVEGRAHRPRRPPLFRTPRLAGGPVSMPPPREAAPVTRPHVIRAAGEISSRAARPSPAGAPIHAPLCDPIRRTLHADFDNRRRRERRKATTVRRHAPQRGGDGGEAMAAVATIPTTTLRSIDYPSTDQFEAWKERISVVFDVAPLAKKHGGAFAAEAHAFHLGEIVVVRTRFDAQRFLRTQKRLRSDLLDHYLVQLYRHGRYVGDVDRRSIEIGPGTVSILDMARPLETRASA